MSDFDAEYKRIAVGTKGQIPNNGLSNGADQSATFRIKHIVGSDSHDISLVYPNWRTETGTGDQDGDNDIMVKATIEYVNADGVTTYFPVYFNGVRTTTIKPGGMIESDPVAIDLKKGDILYTRSYVSVTTLGQKWPVGKTIYAENGDGASLGADTTDGGATGTVGIYGYTPISIIGTPKNKGEKAFLLVGDSIMSGGSDNMNDKGYMVRAIDDKHAYTMISRGGTTADGMANSANRKRMLLAKYHTHAFINFGTNDINNSTALATIQSRILAVCKQLADRGLKVHYMTCTPRTTSTDNWATTANQTTANSYFAAGTASKRGLFNAWVRSLPAPLNGYFDVTSAVETARDSGIWKASHTVDGIHPNDTGYAAAAAVIETGLS